MSTVDFKPPPKGLAAAVRLLDHAPRHMSALPAWFAVLPREQLDAVWATAVISCAAENEYCLADLARALNAVRDWPNIAGVEKPRPEAPAKAVPSQRAVQLARARLRWLQPVLDACPNCGDRVRMTQAFSAPQHRLRARRAALESGLFVESRERAGRIGKPGVVLTRNDVPVEGSPLARWRKEAAT